MKRNHNQAGDQKQPIKRRGRKPGDGILKELDDPKMTALEKHLKLIYGRSAGDPVARTVRTSRNIRKVNDALCKWKAKIWQRYELLAPNVDIGPIAKEWLDWKKAWNEFETQYDGKMEKLNQAFIAALYRDDADWFRKMAKAIEVEVQAEKNGHASYPLHAALLALVDEETIHRTAILNHEPIIFGGKPMKEKPRWTISEISRLMKDHRRARQDDWVWKSTLRRACNELGIPLLKSTPGPKKS